MTITDTADEQILVTGATGLIGSHVLKELLLQNKKVRALYHTTPPQLKNENVDWVNGTILDVTVLEETMKNISFVYHCAAKVSFSPGEKQILYKVNVEGTANVVNACIAAGVKKLLHVSSVAVLERSGKMPVRENTGSATEKSNSYYGKTKYYAEMEVMRGIAEGLNAVLVNPTIVLGAGDWNKGSSELFKSAYKEFPWYSEGTTGFVDVHDVARAMILLMNSSISGERFIISGNNKSYKELFDLAARYFGKKPPYKKVQPYMAAVIWRWAALKFLVTGKKPMITSETARTALAKISYDNTKFLKAFPNFVYTPFELSIERICNELKKLHSL